MLQGKWNALFINFLMHTVNGEIKFRFFLLAIEHEINNLKVINFDIASKICEDKFRLSLFKVIL